MGVSFVHRKIMKLAVGLLVISFVANSVVVTKAKPQSITANVHVSLKQESKSEDTALEQRGRVQKQRCRAEGENCFRGDCQYLGACCCIGLSCVPDGTKNSQCINPKSTLRGYS